MIIFGYYIISFDWNVYLKFFVILFITFGGSFLFYELFIKRFNIIRLLFGMKPIDLTSDDEKLSKSNRPILISKD